MAAAGGNAGRRRRPLRLRCVAVVCVLAAVVSPVARADVTVPECSPAPEDTTSEVAAAEEVRELRQEQAQTCQIVRLALITMHDVGHTDAFMLLGAIVGAPLVVVLVRAVVR